ncbi:Pancreatic secretory granule membrane major glycoprotein GP2 [Stylophora pistillata]|uniref:Pancreatic secretory granule membrane major glycoprotein GP2 n=2 Tax=Stylophora pistillata TaxID=50429 RepID=A0A2B4SDC6_STYPI|nr:Pancreatic secretory granule membrane major glycoprotein GP2 [Stylophora pistillata]
MITPRFLLLQVFLSCLTAAKDNEKIDLLQDDEDFHYEQIGCFADKLNVPRPLPLLVKNYRSRPYQIDWNNINNTIRACAKEVKKAGYVYFGLQFYGECWSGPLAHLTYDEDGESTRCENGVGKRRANFVYRLVSKECKEYRVLQAPDRSIHHSYTPSAPCDIGLKPSWYRFQGRAGTAIANSCPSRFKCGTIVPGWLNGPLPSVQDGIVSRQICFHQDRNCCFTKTQARVRNCAGFYVFYLTSTPYCQLRYCGNGKIG